MLNFPQYTKSETAAILRGDLPEGEDLDLFMRFVDLVYDVFQRNCKDLNEIRHLVALLFPLYVKPVKEGKSKYFTHVYLLVFFYVKRSKRRLANKSTTRSLNHLVTKKKKRSPNIKQNNAQLLILLLLPPVSIL